MKKFVASYLVVFLLIQLSCTSNDQITSAQTTSDPAIATQQFFKALNDKNFNIARQHVTKESATFIDMLDTFYRRNKKANFFKSNRFQVNNVQVKGDSAMADLKTAEDTGVMKIKLVKEAGEWKVAFDMNDLMKNQMNDSLHTKSRNIDDDIHKGIDSVKKGL